MNNKDIPIIFCCYCGIREATTKDHVPPKSIFNKPRPDDLITVPCCLMCNNDASKSDEKFKVYLGMHIARQGGESERLFKEGVLPSAKHNYKLRKNIFNSMYPVNIATDSGIITGKGMAVPWDNEAHCRTIERLIRGLFFHHYGKIISNNASISTFWFKEPQSIFNVKLYENSIANGYFKYQYNKVEESDFDSIWHFNFYNGHYAGGMVLTSQL
ncbi:hypothetical protein [Limnovirga soli]|uniref:HNH endonuclease n=1 Tax=Limnovirga soli TaxID=2656915 RepID=A0A8J8F985_9BACT|nr:hypothetical protein [Limnovirga soli]NNV53850.1 hypothetical protein [Limnovirga soli]